MMDSKKEFTDEALSTLESYILSVAKALKDTDLTETEIEESIADLRYHIIAQCEIRAKSNVVTTDLVKTSIKKLGNPKTIAKSLQSELDVTSVIKDELDASSASLINLGNESSSYSIRAGHFSAGYAVISWLMTSIVIFVFYHENFAPLSILYPYLMGLAVGGLVLTRNLSAYSYNKHLQNNIKPNFHTSIVPIIYIIGGFSKLYLLPVSALWTTPASLVLFLILGSTEYGRKFYSDLVSPIMDRISESEDEIEASS